jgi:hypothetical protein
MTSNLRTYFSLQPILLLAARCVAGPMRANLLMSSHKEIAIAPETS